MDLKILIQTVWVALTGTGARIVDPVAFRASTDAGDCVVIEAPPSVVCGSAGFDSQLWLFRIDAGDGLGLLANDELADGSLSSRIVTPATDGSGAAILVPGDYLLAITAYDNDPTSAGGLIFDVPAGSRTEVSGPDGPGGGDPHTGWTGTDSLAPGVYPYDIVLEGAEGFSLSPCPEIPTVSEWGLVILTLLLAVAGKIYFGGGRGKGSALVDATG